MSTTHAPDRFTTLPDERTLADTVVALEEHGFSVELLDDLDAARARMEGAGLSPGPVRELSMQGGFSARFFFIKDPDGYSIEVLRRGGRFE